MKTTINFPGLLETFFTDRLIRQRQLSEHTIASYRDTFCLVLEFAKGRLKKDPSRLTIEDLDAPFIGAFLDHLEKERGNTARSRNARLAAIHSFFRYAAFHDPSRSALIRRVLAMPSKRYDRKQIEFLSDPETKALLNAPDLNTWGGRRDRGLLLVVVQTGLRVSELIGLRCQDIVLNTGAHVRCYGKGRKERSIPLRKEVVTILRLWLRERNGHPEAPVFPNARGNRFSRDGVEHLLAKHVATAQKECPSLKRKCVSPHVLRHTAAMYLLRHGVDPTVIALWFGHERLETVQMYLHADLALKEKALAKTKPLGVRGGRYKPANELLAFLKNL